MDLAKSGMTTIGADPRRAPFGLAGFLPARLPLPDMPAPLVRLLATTDGTVTEILGAMAGERIDIVKGEPVGGPLDAGLVELDLEDGGIVAGRPVSLHGASTGRLYALAGTLVCPQRLPAVVVDDMARSATPFGRLLNQHRVETYREVLDAGLVETAMGRALHRRYVIRIGGLAAALIFESFPLDALGDLPGGRTA